MNVMQRLLVRTGLSRVEDVTEGVDEAEDLQPVPQLEADEPRGIVAHDGSTSPRRIIDWLSEYAAREYTDEELQQAATLPMVEMILESVSRDVTVHSLKAKPVSTLIGNTWAVDISREFEQIFAFPFVGFTYRMLADAVIRDLLIVGKCPVELLRDETGAASRYSTSGLLSMYEAGELDPEGFLDAVDMGMTFPGPAVGMMRYSPTVIKERRRSDGTYYPKAFMDLSAHVFTGTSWSAQDMPDQDDAPWWPEMDMTMLRYSTGKKHTFGPGKSPTARMYPLIDVLYTVLYRLKDQLDGRMRDKVLSFEQTKVGAATTFINPDQITTIVETVKRDIAAGELPVLGGVTARVSDLGQAQVMSDNMKLLDQMVAVLEIGYGAGALEMGKLLETAEGVKEAGKLGRRQQVGNMLRIVKNELFGFVWLDPYSIWGSTLDLAFKTDLYALDFADRMAVLMEATKHGLPLGLVLDMEMPEWADALRARGIDPYSLVDPAVLSATIAAGLSSNGEEANVTE